MPRIRRLFAGFGLALLLAACATAPQREPESAPEPVPETPAGEPHAEPEAEVAPPAAEPEREAAPADESAKDSETESELLFHVLSAEFAVSQGQPRQALSSYLAAMRLSADPALAEQATRLGVYLDDLGAAEEAARRWRVLVPTDPVPLEALGVVALRRGESGMAAGYLEGALRLQPAGPAEGFSRLGLLLAQERDRAAALDVLQRLAEIYPDEPNAQLAVAELALRAQRPETALAAAERAEALDPDWTAPALVKVRALLQMDADGEAVGLLEKVLEERPDDYDLRLQYARTLLSLEQTERALAQFEHLLTVKPEDGQVLYVAALIALELGETGKARDYLLRLVNVGQRVNEAYYYLGRVAQAENDSKGALRWYGKVGGELRARALMRSAVILSREEDFSRARSRLEEVRRDHPSAASRSYLVEGQLLRHRGELEEALWVYSEGLAEWPQDQDLRYGRALTAAELGRVDQAEADLRALLAEEPDSPEYLNALGYTLVDRTDRYQEGFELIRRAFEQRPQEPAIVDSMGWAYYRLGQLEEAREYLRQAYELRPEEGEIAAHYAEVLWHLGERREARRILAEALERDPDHEVLRETRRRLK